MWLLTLISRPPTSRAAASLVEGELQKSLEAGLGELFPQRQSVDS